jgi:hypothetical protein
MTQGAHVCELPTGDALGTPQLILKRHHLANLNCIALDCRPENPISADLAVVKQRIDAINP